MTKRTSKKRVVRGDRTEGETGTSGTTVPKLDLVADQNGRNRQARLRLPVNSSVRTSLHYPNKASTLSSQYSATAINAQRTALAFSSDLPLAFDVVRR